MSYRELGSARQAGFSVLTPSYNYARFIEDCLSSVEAQDYSGTVEHIVVDGASEDDTVTILQAKESPIRWVTEPDEGQSDALNKALSLATNDWIGWLNADEFYLPGALSSIAGIAEACPDADVIYGDCVFVDEHGHHIRLVPQHPFSQRLLRYYGPFVASCSTFIRRSVLPTQPWDPSLRRIMDWDLWLRLADLGARFHYLPRAIGAFRVHGDRVTAAPAADHELEYEAVRKRYGVRTDGWVRPRVARGLARIGHASAKLGAGSYTRQTRARPLRGADLRWFRCAESRRRADRIIGLSAPSSR